MNMNMKRKDFTTRQDDVIDVGSIRQLFVDGRLIDRLDGASRRLHHPTPRDTAIKIDHPWESAGIIYMSVFRDDDRYRAWYRCYLRDMKEESDNYSVLAYAESADGIRWEKPELGLIDYHGSTKNNLVWTGPGDNVAVFKDPNDVPADERYKAIARASGSIIALLSSDGIHWRLMREKPLQTERPFDSHNIVFFDERIGKYAMYTRGAYGRGRLGRGMSRYFSDFDGLRWVRRALSDDYRNWSGLEPIDTGDAPVEQFYTNATIPYERSPGLYLMFPSRFADIRKPDPAWPYNGVNDIALLSSRDGVHFDRSFMESFVRPGLDPGKWHERSLYFEYGIIQTSQTEMSMYCTEHHRLESNCIRRYTLRPDGFVSVNGLYNGGEMVTKPFVFEGRKLTLNFATSAVGLVLVEMLDEAGKTIPGYSADDCDELFGDELDRTVTWNGEADLRQLAAKPVRLRFALADADLYAFRFCSLDETTDAIFPSIDPRWAK